MPRPPTFRAAITQMRRFRASSQAYRASPGYQLRRTTAIMQRGLDTAVPSGGSYSPSASTSGCSNALVAAGVSCAQQAGLRALGASPASALQQQQRFAAGQYQSRNSGGGYSAGGYAPAPSYPSAPAYAPTSGGLPGTVAGRLAAMRAQAQAYRQGGAYTQGFPAPQIPGVYTEAGYQTTGPLPPATAQPSLSPLPEQQAPQAPQPPAPVEQSQPSQDFTTLFQQSRTARGLMTVDLPGPISPEALAYRLLSTNDPDARGGQVPYTLGHLFQTVSEQAVRLGNLPTAQVYASLASRYPAPPAYGDLGAFVLGGMTPERWLMTGALIFGAAMGLLAVRDARRPARSSRPRRNGRRRSRR